MRLPMLACWFSAIAMSLCPAVPAWGQTKAKQKPVNLLRLPEAAVAKAPSEKDALKALADEDFETVAVFGASKDAPVDVVYGFGNAMVTAEKLVVRLPEKTTPPRVEVLVSRAERPEDFRSLYATALKAIAKPQEFRLPKASARWVMLRWTPLGNANQVSVADVSLVGIPVAVASNYPFSKPAVEAFGVIGRLSSYSKGRAGIAPDEADLFAEVKHGKLERRSFAEAALIASGVVDQSVRQAYLSRLGEIEQDARRAVDGAPTTLAKGDALLRFLHAGPMKNKYVAKQTTLSGILDAGTFNCVSSALMYNVVGRRLGLDLRAIVVPDHAFSILYDGDKHADVETTNKLGFNPERDGAVIKEFEKETGFRYVPDRHRELRREIGDLGLTAVVYANRSTEAAKEKNYFEAMLTAFSALALDPEYSGSVQNAEAAFTNWSRDAVKAGRYQEALAVLDVGLELEPRNAKLVGNRMACWQDWLKATYDKNEEEGHALAVRLLRENPSDTGLRQVTRGQVIREMNDLKKGGKFEAGAAYVARNEDLVKDRAEARGMIAGLYDAWARTFWKNDWDQAIAVYEKGLTVCPNDRILQTNLKFSQAQKNK